MQRSARFHIEILGTSAEPAVLLQFGHDATRRKSGGLAEDRTGRDGSRCVAVVTIGNGKSSTQMLAFKPMHSLQGSEIYAELLLTLQKKLIKNP